MRIKINDTISSTRPYARSDLFRQFSPAFSQLFSSNPLSIEQHDGAAGYVENRDIEEKLLDFSRAANNNICEFVGETGIGKSTYIRKVFGTNNNPRVVGSSLYVPFFLKGREITKDNYKSRFLRQLKRASKVCRDTIEGGWEYSDTEFYKYIDVHNGELLENDDFFDDTESERDVLKRLLIENPYAFYAELLKHLMEKSPLDKLVLVYDDIEEIIYQETLNLYVSQACRFHSCLFNTNEQLFSATSLISLRPATKKVLDATAWYQAYTANNQIIINEPVNIDKIFTARIRYLTTEKFLSRYADRDRIENALQVLEGVVSKFDSRTLEIVSLLSNYNIREALRLLGSILANRRYVQQNRPAQQHFEISDIHFKLNGTTIFKSLFYNEADVFFDHNPFVFNIFKNTVNPQNDMTIPYICKYFFYRNSEEWNNLEKISEEDLREDLKLLINDDVTIDAGLRYLVAEKVVEVFEVDDHGRTTKIYMALPKLFGTIKLLRLNSMLFEALRDDTYFSPETLVNRSGHSIPLVQIHNAKEIADLARKALDEMFASEKAFLSAVHPQDRAIIRRKFGDLSISSIVYEGFIKSSFATLSEATAEIKALGDKIGDFNDTYAE